MPEKKAPEEPKTPKIGDVLERGTLPDGRPFEDIYISPTKRYRLTRVWVGDADEAWDAAQNEDGTTFNQRMNTRLLLCAASVEPKIEYDDIGKMESVEFTALLRSYDRLNSLPLADASGNA